MKKLTPEQEQLVVDNMGLVYHCVSRGRRYRGRYDEFDDLVQEGMVALCKAAKTYQEIKGRFTSYACACIENQIGMFARKRMTERRHTAESLDVRFGDGEESFTMEGIADIERVEDAYGAILLREAVGALDGRKRRIMMLYMAGFRQVEIAEKLGISQSYVSRIISACQREIAESCLSGDRAS